MGISKEEKKNRKLVKLSGQERKRILEQTINIAYFRRKII